MGDIIAEDMLEMQRQTLKRSHKGTRNKKYRKP